MGRCSMQYVPAGMMRSTEAMRAPAKLVRLTTTSLAKRISKPIPMKKIVLLLLQFMSGWQDRKGHLRGDDYTTARSATSVSDNRYNSSTETQCATTGGMIRGITLSKKVGEMGGTNLLLGWLLLLTAGTSAMLTPGLPFVGHPLVELAVNFILLPPLRIVALFTMLSRWCCYL